MEGSGRHEKGLPEEHKQISRASMGVLSSTPVAFLQAEGGSVPAGARLDRRQEAFAIRLASTIPGPRRDLLQATSGLGRRLRGRIGWDIVDQEVEASSISLGRSFPGVVEIPSTGGGEEGKDERVRAAIEKEGKKSGIWIRYGQVARS